MSGISACSSRLWLYLQGSMSSPNKQTQESWTGQPPCEQDLALDVPILRGSSPSLPRPAPRPGSCVRLMLALQSFSEAKHLLRSSSAPFTHCCTGPRCWGCGVCYTRVRHEKAESWTCGIDPRRHWGFQLSF